MAPALDIRLLGDFRLVYDDRPVTTVNTARLQSLLAYLVLHRHSPQARSHLAFLLWPDSSETQAKTNLRNLFHLLRLALPENEQFLSADGPSLQWRPNAPFVLDVAEFERGVVEATSLPALRQAVEWYQGDLLPSCYDDWIQPERERLRQVYLTALERLLSWLEQERDYVTAIHYAQRLLQADPSHEATYRQLMRLHALNGNRAGVEQVYQECQAVLQRELGVEPSPTTRQAYERLVMVETPITQRHNLSPQLTPFVGREEELEQLAKLLANPACRLLTMVGPGGIGKTRLALEAASRQIGQYWHGIYFVSLAAITSADYLTSTIADALNFSFRGTLEPKVQLLNYLREKEMLLILDNFEHLLGMPEGVQLLLDLLTRAPGVKLLVTSRERLSLKGEWLVEIGGLRMPPLGGVGQEEVDSYSAIALFVQTARRVKPDFSLDEATWPEVVRLCRLVEGMPLALELAASWVRLLSCQEIVKEIEQSLGFLTTSLRDVSDRHRSMQAVFDHSWRLVSEEERRVFRQLSVFQGSFRREAADQVAGASLTLLSALVDKSLLRQTSGRYDLHELLRQYGAARLQEVPEEQEAVRDRHSSYYMDYLWRQTGPLHGSQQSRTVAEMKPEIDNIRLAWNWAITHGKFKEIRRAVPSWIQFYDIQGWYHEMEEAIPQTVKKLEAWWSSEGTEDPKDTAEGKEAGIVLGQMLAAQGGTNFRLGQYGKAKQLFQQSLTLLRRLNAQAELAVTLHYFGSLAESMGDYADAQALLQEGLAINQQLADQRGVALCLAVLGMVASSLGEYEQAASLMRQSVELLRAIGEQHYLSITLAVLGNVVSALGNLSEAKQLLRESLAISQALGDR